MNYYCYYYCNRGRTLSYVAGPVWLLMQEMEEMERGLTIIDVAVAVDV